MCWLAIEARSGSIPGAAAQAAREELTDASATAFKANAGWNASDERPLLADTVEKAVKYFV
jgi:hypothetical protein